MIKKELLETLTQNFKGIENSSIIFYLSDLNGNIVYASSSFKRLLQISQSDKTISSNELFEKDNLEFSESDTIVEQKEIRDTIRVRHRLKDGNLLWLKLDKMPYYNSEKVVTGILVFATDITHEISLKLRAQQLHKILTAHLKVEETLKNLAEVPLFPDLLAQSLVNPELFTAVMVERFLDKEQNFIEGTAAWINRLNILKTKDLKKDKHCSYYSDLITDEQINNLIVKDVNTKCPWSDDYKKSTLFISKIRYGSKVYGIICLRLDRDWNIDPKTKEMLNQLIEKIAFGFYTLETQRQILQIQESMEQRLKIYKLAIDSINDAVWEWNLETDEVFLSDKYYTMLDYEPGDFEPSFESWKKLVHPADIEEAQRLIKLHLNDKNNGYEVEIRMKTKTGTYKWILERGKTYETDEDGTPKKVIGTHVDISELKQKEVELAENNEELEAANEELSANNEEILSMNEELEKLYLEQESLTDQINRILRLMGQIAIFETNENEFLEEALDLALNLVQKTTRGKIRMLKNNCYTVLAQIGFNDGDSGMITLDKDQLKLPENSQIVTKETITNYYNIDDNALHEIVEEVSELKERIITPIKWNAKIIGSIEIDNFDGTEEFRATDIKKMDSFANLLSVFYKLRKYIKEEGKFQTDLILTLVKALEYYDEYTRGHSERVASWSVELAKAMNISPEGQRKIYFASLMHDIGKIFVQQSVLNKVSALTSDEFDLIQIHPVKSAELINQVEGMESFARIVRHHHEKYNGKGYPDGLIGKAIPYFSRIITVADAYDAMTSKRPYRKPFSEEEAIRELRRCKGSQFDPLLIEPFIEKVIHKEMGQVP